MTLSRFFTAIAAILFVGTLAFAENKPIAMVNGKPLTGYELNEEFQAILPMMGSFHGGVTKEKFAEIKEKALNKLIEKELQSQYAEEKGLSVSKKELAAEYAKFEDIAGSSKKLKEALKESGITKEELNEFIKKRLLAVKGKDLAVTSRAKVSDEELKDYYEKNKTLFKRPEEFRASHILIGVDPSSSSEERAVKLTLAKEVLARIKAGEDFAKLAMKHSTDTKSGPLGGDIGTFHKGMAEEEFEKTILSLKVGEIGDVTETMYGYHIIKLTGYKPEELMSFDEIKAGLKGKLEKQKGSDMYSKWIEEMKGKAKIEILEK